MVKGQEANLYEEWLRAFGLCSLEETDGNTVVFSSLKRRSGRVLMVTSGRI